MSTKSRDERLQELGESNYLMLRDTYCSIQQLKGLVDRMYAGFMQHGITFELDTLMAVKLTTDRLFDELERYLRPECDPDSAYDDALAEEP